MASHDVAIGRRSVLAGSVAATMAAVAAVLRSPSHRSRRLRRVNSSAWHSIA